MSRKKKKTKKNYIICILLVVAIIALLLVIKLLNKPNEVDVKTSALRLENTSNYTNEVIVYLEKGLKNGEVDICYEESEYCGNEYLRIKAKSDESYLIENYKEKYFFYADDDKVKVYDKEEDKNYVIDLLSPDNNFFFIANNDKLVGIIYFEEDTEKTNYLLIEGNKFIYKDKYDYLSSLGNKYLSADKYNSDGSQKGAYILDATKERKPLITKELKADEYYSFFNFGTNHIVFESGKRFELYDNDTLELLYKSNKANLIDGNGYPRFLYDLDQSGNIYIYDDGYLSILDRTGKEIKKSSEKIIGVDLVDKYIINTDNNLLTIIDIDNNSYKIAPLNNGKLDYYEYLEENNRKGIVFAVLDKTLSYKTVFNSCKNSTCKDLSLEEFTKDYKDQLGYEYFFDYSSLKVTKKPVVITPSDIIE